MAGLVRSTLREFYPAALAAFDDLDGRDALAVLAIAPNPLRGKALSQSKIASALRRAGRQRNIDTTAAKIQAALRTGQLTAPPAVAAAFGHTVAALAGVLGELSRQIENIEGELSAHFDQHPDAPILRSHPPAWDPFCPARVLAEFGDDPTRYADARIAA